jgi:hypothetical protein
VKLNRQLLPGENSTKEEMLLAPENYDRSKRVTKLFEFDHSRFSEGKNLDIPISSKKTAVLLPRDCLEHYVVDTLK